MGALFISLLTLILILISAFVILLVLMQKTSQSGGMGAALGGGAAESAFGSDTNNVLTKATIYSIVAFFIISLGLFLIYQSKAAERTRTLNPNELISATDSDLPESGTAEKSLADAEEKVEAALDNMPTKSDLPTVDVEMPSEITVPVSD